MRHAVTPFVVVPGDDLDEVALFLAEHQRERQVNRGASEDRPCKSMLTSGSSTACRMPLKRGSGGGLAEAWRSSSVVVAFSNLSGEVHDRDRGGGHTQGIAVELALQIGDDQRQGLGRARGGRDDVQRGSACAAQVLCGRSRIFWSLV